MEESTDVTARLARWSQSMVGIAQTGLAFANNPYDVVLSPFQIRQVRVQFIR
jgi:hypothetical protein